MKSEWAGRKITGLRVNKPKGTNSRIVKEQLWKGGEFSRKQKLKDMLQRGM